MTMPPPGPPPGQPPGPPWYPEQPTAHIPAHVPAAEPEQRSRDPLSVVLIAVIVVAVVIAGALAAELYARHRADAIVSKAVSCVVQDSATVSFGLRPFLVQHFTHSYRDMVVETAGNQIREAKGMKLRLRLDDVRIDPSADPGSGSLGTLGELDADITWSADGIRQTVAGIIPFLGGLVSNVTTAPAAGTIELQGPLGTVTVMPQVTDGTLVLQVAQVTGLGLTLPSESVQPALDAFTKTLTSNLPMGIRAESVGVTDDGVVARFATRDATIPDGQQDPCFAGI